MLKCMLQSAYGLDACLCMMSDALMLLQDVPHILAAMTPCSRLYGYLGQRLAQAYPNAKHAYQDWINTYASASYRALPASKEMLLNRLGRGVEVGEQTFSPWLFRTRE